MKRLFQRMRRHPLGALSMRVRDRYREDGVGLLAGAVAYHGFLSMFPMLLIGAAVLGVVFERDPSARAAWAARVSDALPGMGGMVEDLLVRTSQTKAVTGVVGVLGLIWTGTGAVRASGAALAKVFRCPPPEGPVRKVLWSVGSLVSLGLVFVASATASSVAGSLQGRGLAAALFGLLAFAVGLVMDFLLFVFAYRLLTQGRGPAFRKLVVGSAVAAAGWSSLRLIGVWYFTRSLAGAQAVYGVFAGTVAVLVILSAGARVFMGGAVLNAVLAADPRVGSSDEPQAVLASGMRS